MYLPVITVDRYDALLNNEIALESMHEIYIKDFMHGFSEDYSNVLLDKLEENEYCNPIYLTHFIDYRLTKRYNTLDLRTSMNMYNEFLFMNHINYNIVDYSKQVRNVLCSFNGMYSTGRVMLLSMLKQYGLFNSEYCSKNFVYDVTKLDGFLTDYLEPHEERVMRKFFSFDKDFSKLTIFFGDNNNIYKQMDETGNNLSYISQKMKESFLYLVTETIPTNYYPFITEKFLHGIIMKTLFLTYGQPKWYEFMETYLGFKKYDKIFDYSFDNIKNPVKRLDALITQVIKLSALSLHDLHDLHLCEEDTIKYNFEHYISGAHLTYSKDDSVYRV